MTPELWAKLAVELPLVVGLALLILQLRKSETEERQSRDAQWQEFLAQRDEQWQTFLNGMQQAYEVLNASLLKEMGVVNSQMQAVTTQMQAVQISLERVLLAQGWTNEELRMYFNREGFGTKPLSEIEAR